MRPIVVAALLVSASACATTTKPETAPEPSRSVQPPPRAAPPETKPVDPPPPDPVEVYRAALEREVAGVRRLSRIAAMPGEPMVRAFRGRQRAKGVLHVTFGLSPAGAETRIELLARAEQAGEGVAEVLRALARLARDEGKGGAWEGYRAVALEAPVRGLQHFDLLPAGDVDLGASGRVTLLRVVPLTLEEYEAAQEATSGAWSGAASADLDASSVRLERWAPALAEPEAPDAAPPPVNSTE